MRVIRGLGSSNGIVTAKAAVVLDSDDFDKVEEGDVLVTINTDPSMVPIINKAVAIVCDVGGITSHPSIIARELGIPCVVATETATSDIKGGDLVEVDGGAGSVRIIEPQRP